VRGNVGQLALWDQCFDFVNKRFRRKIEDFKSKCFL
jgi:hypothetical protein